jgi:hypothetical protein
MSNDIVEAKVRYAEAEGATCMKSKAAHFLAASKLYLRAIHSIDDDTLKRSLIYLATNCASKASSCTGDVSINSSNESKQEEDLIANCLSSERVIQQAHLLKLQRSEEVSTLYQPSFVHNE